MQITVRLLASYRRYLPQDHDEQAGYLHDIAVGSTLSELIAGLPIPPEEPFTFFLNGRHAETDQVLQEGDVVSVFPAVGGGD